MAYQVTVDAPAPLQKLFTEFLDLVRYQDREDLNADQLNFMLATVADQVKELAATEGYFSPQTKVQVEGEGDAAKIALTVDPGPRTEISKVDLQVIGQADVDKPSPEERVREAWLISEGDPFRNAEWNEAKREGLRILQSRRYAAARIENSVARVYADQQKAELQVTYDSGPAFTLGELNISGTRRYPESIVRNVNPLERGEQYSAERLLEFQRQVQRTPYFSNVVISIDNDPAKAELAPVKVQVTEFPAHLVRTGVGYGTDTGAHMQARYSYLNAFNRAIVFNSQLVLEEERQIGSLELAMPPGTDGFVNSVHTSIERTTLEGILLQSNRLGVRKTRNTDNNDLAYSLEYYRDNLRQEDGSRPPPDIVVQPGSHQALVAGFMRTIRRVDNPSFPRSGNIISVQAGVAVEGLLTDQTFVRLYGRMRQYYPVGKRNSIILRGELGAVLSEGGNASIPASLLFRAGGTESVRGYAFNSIGNVQNGTVYPTRYLAAGGIEYQHWLSEQWGAAVFYDVGTATDDWNGKDFFHAVGVGARYRSPVGPINVDLAYGFFDNRIRPHLSLGVAF